MLGVIIILFVILIIGMSVLGYIGYQNSTSSKFLVNEYDVIAQVECIAGTKTEMRYVGSDAMAVATGGVPIGSGMVMVQVDVKGHQQASVHRKVFRATTNSGNQKTTYEDVILQTTSGCVE
jgi:hypothetical protein